MASFILRQVFRKSNQLTGISKLQARCVRCSVVVEEKNASIKLSTMSNDDNSKENNQPIDIKRKRVQEFMENYDKDPIYQQRKIEIEKHLEQWKYENVMLPDTIRDEHWLVLLTENYGYNKAKNYLQFLKKVEFAELADKQKKEEKKKQREERLKNNLSEEDHSRFSIHLYTREVEERTWNKMTALQSDIPVVIDMHFPDCTTREQTAAAEQIFRLTSNNMKHRQPLQLHVTSVGDNVTVRDYSQAKTRMPLYFHENHFMDIFPPEQLLYLSPDAPPLKRFNPNMIYIIGGLVDRRGRPNMTSSTAKMLGIKSASLPLKTNVALESRKELNIDIVFDIVQNMFLYHSWNDSFEISMISKKYKMVGSNRSSKLWDINALRRP